MNEAVAEHFISSLQESDPELWAEAHCGLQSWISHALIHAYSRHQDQLYIQSKRAVYRTFFSVHIQSERILSSSNGQNDENPASVN